MNGFKKEIIVSADDLDDLNHVNNVRYVQWIQDISKEHWQAKASSQMQEEVIWVVLSHHIEYKNAAVLNDPIIISTFIESSSGAKSVRIVEMHHGISKKLLVHASTEWVLLNSESYRPVRIPEEIKEIFL
ncbi:acyl-CoA thioesterase [Maribacter arcticus]|uniref:Acyl-CoA thioester hydrolase n=1 Tax=Maribacter arcticus TaxID=561365 RepID=A0A1T5DVR4_9FLAO|nr:thioesterase family protein [Maribacter arcticus]SKB75714.1 acyl-CoA thioester hydrolase [Maribacter arcticus]|tara:strand:+ start:4409 stop:4798 length:390 start_codon:yes stop_codon:yes gene_type:complete